MYLDYVMLFKARGSGNYASSCIYTVSQKRKWSPWSCEFMHDMYFAEICRLGIIFLPLTVWVYLYLVLCS